MIIKAMNTLDVFLKAASMCYIILFYIIILWGKAWFSKKVSSAFFKHHHRRLFLKPFQVEKISTSLKKTPYVKHLFLTADQ